MHAPSMGPVVKRREFITLVGGAIAATPVAIHAQQSTHRVVGILSPEGPKTGNVDGLVQGLRELGYVEGRNIRFEYRWAEGKFDRLLKGKILDVKKGVTTMHLNFIVSLQHWSEARVSGPSASQGRRCMRALPEERGRD